MLLPPGARCLLPPGGRLRDGAWDGALDGHESDNLRLLRKKITLQKATHRDQSRLHEESVQNFDAYVRIMMRIRDSHINTFAGQRFNIIR
jgi:hypothetical protein